MARRTRGAAIVLDSFLDIMTCMLGVLMLIILLTSIDASQIKILIPTPLAHATNKKPIYLECRKDELFLVPVDALRAKAEEELNRLKEEAKKDPLSAIARMSNLKLKFENYEMDLNYAMKGQLVLSPIPESRGYALVDVAKELPDGWFGRLLLRLDKQNEMLAFLVRDDSYDVFKRARGLAWAHKVEVSYELLDEKEPLRFGLGGIVPIAQ